MPTGGTQGSGSLEDFRPYLDILTMGGLNVFESTILMEPLGTFFQAGEGSVDKLKQEDQTFSLFAQGDFKVTDRLVATLGVNYTDVEKTVTSSQDYNIPFGLIDISPFSASPLFPVLANLQSVRPVVTLPNAVENGVFEDNETTYTARLAYDVNDQLNVYASYATGYKPVSVNLSRFSAPTAADFAALSMTTALPASTGIGSRVADAENSEVFEIGVKAGFENGYVNITVFEQTIEDFQVNLFTGLGFEFQNAEEQSTTGIEIDTAWNPVEPLTLTFAGTFIDPEYDSFPNFRTGTGTLVDLSGEKPAEIHETSISTSATYARDLGHGRSGFARVSYLYESEANLFDNPSSQAATDATREVNIVNASLGLNFDSGVEIQLYGRNIFDDEHFTVATSASFQQGSFVAGANQPATYGITVRKTF